MSWLNNWRIFVAPKPAKKNQSPSHLALPAFTIHLKAFVDTWYDMMIWQHWQRGEAGGSVFFWDTVFFQVFWSNTHPRVFVALKHIFQKKLEPNLEIESCSVLFLWYLSNQINFNPVSPNPEKPGTNGKDWNFSSEQNSPRNHSLWFGISGSAKRGRVFSRVGLMLQNSWQLQLIWKLMILICFHRALFFTSEVCRFCWVPDVYFTSSRYLNTLLPPISILSNLITDASQEACWIKGILVTYFQNGRNVKEWSANPEFEPGGICMWFYRISTKMNHQQAIPRQKLTRVCI